MKISIGVKLWMGFMSILLVLVVVGNTSYHSTIKLTEAAHWREHTYSVLAQLDQLLVKLQDAETGQRGYVITGDEQYLGPYRAALPEIDRIQQTLRRLTTDNPVQQQRLDKLGPLVAQKLGVVKATVELRRDKGFTAARDRMLAGDGRAVMDDVRALLNEMANTENELLGVRTVEADKSARNALLWVIYGTVVAGMIVFGAAYLLSRHIAQPLKNATLVAEHIASGDLSMDVELADRSDEIGSLMQANQHMLKSLRQMAQTAQSIAQGDLTQPVHVQSEKDQLGHAFAAMNEHLRRLTQEIREGLNVLTSSSSEIMATTAQVASGAAETATAVSQTTTTVEEVKQTVLVSSQKAHQVSEEAQRTTEVSRSGRQAVEDVVDGMSRIREQTTATAESIARLSEQSLAIGEMIALVNDLAEQSNVLAVNAAIEASKAGEYGKGFSVVAQEIKSLAEQSKQAASQVRAMLGDIQKATGAAVKATEINARVVEDGSRQSVEAGHAIHALEDSITQSAQAAMQIAASSQQQLVGMDQVAQAMNNIRRASAQNLAGTRQAEAAAQGLHELGIRLKQLVERYRV
ncbi:methyl-accepting chemotaxis protein [Novimethylophilus kurashikiensis]|uniref:Methyl-accepting chemotaxis protein n=1 Tax=Novimethylophilus kurashikiensis TaxID=1825523 RepID=A0A2R5F3H5_9PROT|nr:CHASE3 domain-containing protein [Novimethylophilus kurashikiensis]GBG13056.1 methyl-accepting chemotaxis protein [Novimethylophilus kurashikiensis]